MAFRRGGQVAARLGRMRPKCFVVSEWSNQGARVVV